MWETLGDHSFEGAGHWELGIHRPLASPAMTGSPTAPRASASDNDTSVVQTELNAGARKGKLSSVVSSKRSRQFFSPASICAGLYWPLDNQPDGTAADGDTYRDRVGTNNGTGSDGANNTGLTNIAEKVLSYP
jgi:hypothetical protein